MIKVTTERELRSLIKSIGETSVGGVKGLVIRRRGNANGEVTSARWYLRLQGRGGSKISIGEYPEMGLAEARIKAGEVRASMADGINPIVEAKKKAQKEKAEQESKAVKR